MGTKSFKSIDDLIELLNSRGVETDENTRHILLQEGYYNVINGYKEPFIDKMASDNASDDRYYEGVNFNDIYTLYKFDRDLRKLVFGYLIKAEVTAKTVISHAFAENHRSILAYFDTNNFCSYSDRFRCKSQEQHDKDIEKLLSTFNDIKSNMRFIYIRHYNNTNQDIPIWVLANAMTFGNIAHFYDLMLPVDRKLSCKYLLEATRRNIRRQSVYGNSKLHVSQKLVSESLEMLFKFRNICAHDERLYCASINGRMAKKFRHLVWCLEIFLDIELFDEFIIDLINFYNERLTKLTPLARNAVNASGFSQLMKEITERMIK